MRRSPGNQRFPSTRPNMPVDLVFSCISPPSLCLERINEHFLSRREVESHLTLICLRRQKGVPATGLQHLFPLSREFWMDRANVEPLWAHPSRQMRARQHPMLGIYLFFFLNRSSENMNLVHRIICCITR